MQIFVYLFLLLEQYFVLWIKQSQENKQNFIVKFWLDCHMKVIALFEHSCSFESLGLCIVGLSNN